MKKILVPLGGIPLLVGAVLSCTQAPAQTEKFTEHIHKEYTLSKGALGSTLAIYNIDGFIKVEGYSGDKVIIDIDKTISGKTAEWLETGKKEFHFEIEQNADSIIAYIVEPYDSRPNRNWKERNNNRRIEYRYNLEFTVKVPFAMNVSASTVNNGDVSIADVTGQLKANNVNGAITLKNVKGSTKAHTINGDLVANYLSMPPEKSEYYTLNGNIRITYPSNLSADCQFKSFNGEFFTDFPNVEALPVKVVKNQETKESKTIYKLNTETSIRIGTGGRVLKFETFNGNIYIKKQS